MLKYDTHAVFNDLLCTFYTEVFRWVLEQKSLVDELKDYTVSKDFDWVINNNVSFSVH